jgi:hypothetical protein
VSIAAAAASPIGFFRRLASRRSNFRTSHLRPIITRPPATKPASTPAAVPNRSASGTTPDATAAITAPAAKCWIALRTFRPAFQKVDRIPPAMPAAVAARTGGRTEASSLDIRADYVGAPAVAPT